MFNCKTCNYNPNDKQKFMKHIDTKKHQINISERNNINNTFNNFICEYCNKIFKNKSSIYKHKKICAIYKKIITNDENNTVNIIDNNSNIINKIEITGEELKSEIHNKNVELKSEIHNKSLELKSEIIQVKKSVNKAITRTTSLIKYLMANYKDVHPLIQFTEDQCKKLLNTGYEINNNLIDDNNNEYINILVKSLLLDYKKNRLHSYIGKIIYQTISDKDIKNQPVWTSDTSRLNYAVKLTIDKWYSDHSGEKFCDFVITPISKYIYQIIEIYKDNLGNIGDNNWHLLKEIIELSEYIRSEEFVRDILKYLSPKFRFLEEELKISNRMCNVEKYKKILFEERDKKILEEQQKKLFQENKDFFDEYEDYDYIDNSNSDYDDDSDSDDDCEHNNYMVIKKRII
jgi:hypothetical protein